MLNGNKSSKKIRTGKDSLDWLVIDQWCVCVVSHVQLFATPWTVGQQASLSMGVFRQEYWSGFPHPPPGDLPDPGIKPSSLSAPALAGRFLTTGLPGKP